MSSEPIDRDETAEDNPELSDIIGRNISTIIQLRMKDDRERTFEQRLSDHITAFSGRMSFVTVHAAWFASWILLNAGLFGLRPFDPFPYSLLTMVVSLEAIFLATFVLISQNRSHAEAQRRADLDLHIGLVTEHELTRVLQMLDAIQVKLGIRDADRHGLANLELETKPEVVLAEIERLYRRAVEREGPDAPVAAG